MKTITASDANRHFSKLLKEVSSGESYTVISRGKPVAVVNPVHSGAGERSVARRQLLKRLKAVKVTGSVEWTREELYEKER